MQEELIELIWCPKCNGDIEILKRIEIIKQNNINFINSGVLKCKRCNSQYPIIDRIPRMLKDEELSQSEKKAIADYKNSPFKEPKVLVKPEIGKDEKYKIIENLVKEKLQLQFKSIKSEKMREEFERAINYKTYQTEKKERFISTCIPYLTKKPGVIADIGGGQGGAISCFSRYFTPKIAILIDIDIFWAKIALIRDPMVNVIRANAVNMPLKNRSIDFLFTITALEHISSWGKAVEEIARISKNALINYSPNKWFLYDWGHRYINAPLVTILPKGMGSGVAYLFHKLRRTGYSYDLIRNQLDNIHYISRRNVVKILGKYGIVKNVFPEFLHHSVASDSYFYFNRLKSFLKSHPIFLNLSSKIAVMLGIEPQVYLIFKNRLDL